MNVLLGEREIKAKWVDPNCKCGYTHSEHYRTEGRPCDYTCKRMGFEIA
jgi:hypothetical protein